VLCITWILWTSHWPQHDSTQNCHIKDMHFGRTRTLITGYIQIHTNILCMYRIILNYGLQIYVHIYIKSVYTYVYVYTHSVYTQNSKITLLLFLSYLEIIILLRMGKKQKVECSNPIFTKEASKLHVFFANVKQTKTHSNFKMHMTQLFSSWSRL
jgi:hypothetical protein